MQAYHCHHKGMHHLSWAATHWHAAFALSLLVEVPTVAKCAVPDRPPITRKQLASWISAGAMVTINKVSMWRTGDLEDGRSCGPISRLATGFWQSAIGPRAPLPHGWHRVEQYQCQRKLYQPRPEHLAPELQRKHSPECLPAQRHTVLQPAQDLG